jgi:hypothetical protein
MCIGSRQVHGEASKGSETDRQAEKPENSVKLAIVCWYECCRDEFCLQLNFFFLVIFSSLYKLGDDVLA